MSGPIYCLRHTPRLPALPSAACAPDPASCRARSDIHAPPACRTWTGRWTHHRQRLCSGWRRFHDTGVDGKAFTADQPRRHAGPHDAFRTRDGRRRPRGNAHAGSWKRRVVGNLILKAEPAKPPVGEVQRHPLAQPTLRTEAIAVTHQEYPDHQLGIDRRPHRMAVQGRQLFVQPVHLQNAIDLPQQVIGGDAIFQAELVEQPILQTRLTRRQRCFDGITINGSSQRSFSTASVRSGHSGLG